MFDATPDPDFHTGLRVLTHLHQNPDDAPQQLQVVRVEQTEEDGDALVELHLLLHLGLGTEQAQELCRKPGVTGARGRRTPVLQPWLRVT